MSSEIFRRLKSLPIIVSIVIKQATRRRALGIMTAAEFQEQMQRLIREELEPKGLTLLVRDLRDGGTRIIISECVGDAVCDLLEFSADGTLKSKAEETSATAS